jgi:hypothetical protein
VTPGAGQTVERFEVTDMLRLYDMPGSDPPSGEGEEEEIVVIEIDSDEDD